MEADNLEGELLAIRHAIAAMVRAMNKDQKSEFQRQMKIGEAYPPRQGYAPIYAEFIKASQ